MKPGIFETKQFCILYREARTEMYFHILPSKGLNTTVTSLVNSGVLNCYCISQPWSRIYHLCICKRMYVHAGLF